MSELDYLLARIAKDATIHDFPAGGRASRPKQPKAAPKAPPKSPQQLYDETMAKLGRNQAARNASPPTGPLFDPADIKVKRPKKVRMGQGAAATRRAYIGAGVLAGLAGAGIAADEIHQQRKYDRRRGK